MARRTNHHTHETQRHVGILRCIRNHIGGVDVALDELDEYWQSVAFDIEVDHALLAVHWCRVNAPPHVCDKDERNRDEEHT